MLDRVDRLAGLEESEVWREIDPALGLRGPALAVMRYAFTAMLNNAIDHSAGSTVHTRAWQDGKDVVVEIADDGVGVFRRLQEGMDLPDVFASVAELTKGKRTTAPDAHSGEGIFFTSKAVDLFAVEANGIAWTVDGRRDDQAVGLGDTTVGTRVRLRLDRATTLDLRELFGRFSEDLEFTRTRPVIRLFGLGVDFVSRSEGKRLLVGLDRFTEVELDFTGVRSVGQGFVDEVFRVWPRSHPDTRLEPTHMNEAVEFMVRRGLPRG